MAAIIAFTTSLLLDGAGEANNPQVNRSIQFHTQHLAKWGNSSQEKKKSWQITFPNINTKQIIAHLIESISGLSFIIYNFVYL